MNMSYIYKITNLLNNKIYIGYTSRSIFRRFYEHIWEAYNSSYEENKSLLYSAIRKYGAENFIIESLIEFNEEKEDWKLLEKKYIKEQGSLSPNGYNILEGGNRPPIHYGNENNKTKIKDEKLILLIEKLKNPLFSYNQISQEFNISLSELYRINNGTVRYNKDLDYPIRKYSLQEEYALQVINILKNDKTLSYKKISELIPNYFRENEICSINTGHKYRYLWNGDFPIRKERVPDDYQEKLKLTREVVNYIKNNKTTQIALQKKFNCGRYIIEQIIKGKYPYYLNDIKYPIKLNK